MIYTGTHGVLTLTNGEGKKVAIYLEPNKRKMPVPEHFWKVRGTPRPGPGRHCTGASDVLQSSFSIRR